jgi:Dolichyl-phosphate-mannose-protein mannosyltransferase
MGFGGDRSGQSVTPRRRGIDGRTVALRGMAVLTTGAITVRLWLMLGYREAFLGFPDSGVYVTQAMGNVRSLFGSQKPAGYATFLKVIHLVSDRVSLTILVQHTLGVVTGVLLYKAVRRTGAPPYLGLVPAAIAFFGGTGLFLEHSLLSDAPFAFLQAISLYAAVRALSEPRLRWPLLSGLAIGVSFWVKTVGFSSAVLVPPLLLFAAAGTRAQKRSSAATAAAAVVVLVAAYVPVQGLLTGYWGYERLGGLNLYGRVATFVDCSRFTPPKGTQFLCPSEPLGHRGNQSYFEYDPRSPVYRYGPITLQENGPLQSFSVAAIEHEPLAYLAAILRGLPFYISARPGEGYTPETLREELLNRKTINPVIARYYPHRMAYTRQTGSIRSLVLYESHTRVQGPFLVVLLLAAIGGAPLLSGRMRWATILFTLTSVLSATFAVAANSYDARFAYPAFGPLAAGAALGAWGIAVRLKREKERRWRRTYEKAT